MRMIRIFILKSEIGDAENRYRYRITEIRSQINYSDFRLRISNTDFRLPTTIFRFHLTLVPFGTFSETERSTGFSSSALPDLSGTLAAKTIASL